MTGRELWEAKRTSDAREGSVELPVNFEDISVLMGISMEDSVSRTLDFIEKNKKVVPQYHSIPEKIGGMFYGFYYNPCTYAQNDINDKLLSVFKEFCECEKIKQDLFARINVLQDRIEELSK
ncbi:MAG: hypothetical protein K6F79_01045 [Saccharofermentans sp.]|nr:hypothetical protein [Saccharofermentans sp.]